MLRPFLIFPEWKVKVRRFSNGGISSFLPSNWMPLFVFIHISGALSGIWSRIFLADLTYNTVTLSTDAFPLNVGFIASYTKKIFDKGWYKSY